MYENALDQARGKGRLLYKLIARRRRSSSKKFLRFCRFLSLSRVKRMKGKMDLKCFARSPCENDFLFACLWASYVVCLPARKDVEDEDIRTFSLFLLFLSMRILELDESRKMRNETFHRSGDSLCFFFFFFFFFFIVCLTLVKILLLYIIFFFVQ